MFDKWKNLSIGILATTAVGLVVWVLLFLHPTFGDGERALRVRFPNIDKVGVGTRVTYAGRPIGEVTAVQTVPDARSKDPNGSEAIYSYELTLALDSHVHIYSCDAIQIQTSGLMGERNIAIVPKRAEDGAARLLGNDELVYASYGGSVEDTFQGLNNVAKKAEKTLDELILLLDRNQTAFQKTLEAIEVTSQQVENFVKRSNELDLPGTMAKLLNNANDAADKLNSAMTKVQNAEVIENISLAAANLKDISQSIDHAKINEFIQGAKVSADQLTALAEKASKTWNNVDNTVVAISNTMDKANNIMTRLADGEGTLGKLLYNDDIYLRTQGILAKIDTTMGDVNNYGMLFHLDKSWQRLRRQRILELEQLQTATQFKNYLNSELNRISTSVSRVALAADKADAVILQSDNKAQTQATRRAFIQTYAELVGQLQNLERTLQMYGGDNLADNGEMKE